MAHQHSKKPGHQHSHSNSQNIKAALFLNLGFTVLELIGGVLSNSLAIISDAIHDLGDSLILAFGYYSEKQSTALTANPNYTFGLRQLPLISAAVNGLVLLGGSIWVLVQAVPRLQNPELVKTEWMIPLALLGMLVNGAAVLRLKKGDGFNSRMVALHLLEDALGWVAILIGGIMIFITGYHIIDPILSLLISGYIFINAFKSFREVFSLMVQRSPSEIEVPAIRQRILEIPEVEKVHDLNIWSLEGTHHILSLHAQVSPSISPEDQLALKNKIRTIIAEYGEIHSTIEIDHFPKACKDHC